MKETIEFKINQRQQVLLDANDAYFEQRRTVVRDTYHPLNGYFSNGQFSMEIGKATASWYSRKQQILQGNPEDMPGLEDMLLPAIGIEVFPAQPEAAESKNGQKLPDLYTQFGTYGNNTTIPEDERARIALSDPDQGDGSGKVGRLVRAGEHALDAFYQEWNLAPKGGTWYEYMHFEPPTPQAEPHLSTRPLSEQRRRRKNGGLSKSPRNMENFIKRNGGEIFQT